MKYEIVVSNVGIVDSGTWSGNKANWNDGSLASAMFKHYSRLSMLPGTRFAGQQVTWWVDSERFQNYNPNTDPTLITAKPEPKPEAKPTLAAALATVGNPLANLLPKPLRRPPAPRRKPTRNERQLESGYQAYSREEEDTCDF